MNLKEVPWHKVLHSSFEFYRGVPNRENVSVSNERQQHKIVEYQMVFIYNGHIKCIFLRYTTVFK